MAYCESTDLTFPATMKTADITKVIDSSTRQIDNYLRSKDVVGTEGVDDLKEAAIKLCKAGIVEWWISHGQYIRAQGTQIDGADPLVTSADIAAAQLFENQAYAILDRYATAIAAPPTSTGVIIVPNTARWY